MRSTMHRAPSRVFWPVVALGVALLVAGLLAWAVQAAEPDSPRTVTDTSPSTTTTAPPSATVAGTVLRQVAASWKPGTPDQVRIPSLGVVAPVIPITTQGNTLVPPNDPQQLGWWSAGAMPGAKTGSALVTGHTVHTGGGALDDLETLEAGDEVVVRTGHEQRIQYVVQRVRVFSKGSVAQEAERLFSQEVPGRLVLITCEDWDGSRYLSNVVVVAEPVG
ncbi:class F sortase [Nocardioides dongkuii]|uniref:class F sortase n=1 Tax=Nocardioides dongkuii TaxID=2760089 RepID=UPI001D0C4519|nr:class F sortase [Nocardioides dongkuii]